MKQLHAKRISDKVARKEREARQRKQDVDQKKAQIDAQQSKEEAKLLRKLLGIGTAEREEAHILWEKRQREKRAAKIKDSMQMSKNVIMKQNAYLTDFIEDSKAKFEARKGRRKRASSTKKAREERSC